MFRALAKLTGLALAVVLVFAAPLIGATPRVSGASAGAHAIPRAAMAADACADGLVYDDGVLDEAIRFFDPDGNGLTADVVMRFDLGAPDTAIEELCVCWNRDEVPDQSFDHELVFFADDGVGGTPGTEIAAVPFTRSGIPTFPDSSFVSYDLTPFAIRSPTSNVYAGVRWTSSDRGTGGFFLCIDQNGPGQKPMYAAPAGTGSWLTTDAIFAGSTVEPPTALMVRLRTTPAAVAVLAIPALTPRSLALLALLLLAAGTWLLRRRGVTPCRRSRQPSEPHP